MATINKKSTTQLLAEAIRFEHWARFHCMREIPKTLNDTLNDELNDTVNDEINNPASQKTNDEPETESANTESADAESENENIEAETALIQIPAVLVELCNEEYPHLSALLSRIQDSEISLESARTHIIGFLREHSELDKENFTEEAFAEEMQAISASKKFTRYLDVFYTFVQEEADTEEEMLTAKEAEIGAEAMAKFMEEAPVPAFSTWTESFHQWAEQRNFRLELE